MPLPALAGDYFLFSLHLLSCFEMSSINELPSYKTEAAFITSPQIQHHSCLNLRKYRPVQ